MAQAPWSRGLAGEIVYGEPNTGAESDIQHLTRHRAAMVDRWGMSDKIGPLACSLPRRRPAAAGRGGRWRKVGSNGCERMSLIHPASVSGR
jgi:ATP-dependent Zn protease